MEMAPESTADIERMEQWAGVAKLRRLEVEWIEGLLAEMAEPSSSARPDEGYAPRNLLND